MVSYFATNTIHVVPWNRHFQMSAKMYNLVCKLRLYQNPRGLGAGHHSTWVITVYSVTSMYMLYFVTEWLDKYCGAG